MVGLRKEEGTHEIVRASFGGRIARHAAAVLVALGVAGAPGCRTHAPKASDHEGVCEYAAPPLDAAAGGEPPGAQEEGEAAADDAAQGEAAPEDAADAGEGAAEKARQKKLRELIEAVGVCEYAAPPIKDSMILKILGEGFPAAEGEKDASSDAGPKDAVAPETKGKVKEGAPVHEKAPRPIKDQGPIDEEAARPLDDGTAPVALGPGGPLGKKGE